MINTTVHDAPTVRAGRTLVAIVVAVLLAAATAFALANRSDEPPAATVAATELAGLHLRPGTYRFTVEELSQEVTTAAGEVIAPATTADPTHWTLTFRSADSWEERNADGTRVSIREDGQFRQLIDGQPAEPGVESPEMSEAAEAAGSSMPDGGPRVELNPYGASFLLQLARADGGAESTTTVDCGGLRCRMSMLERDVPRPESGSEHLWSLPWRDRNVERVTVVYEPDTRIVHRYETTFNDVVLHRFVLTDLPRP